MPPLPKILTSKMIRQMADESMAGIRKLADEYNAAKNLPQPAHGIQPEAVNPARGKNIAKAFEQMQHNPNDPAVRKAYDALIGETAEQFKQLKKSGVKFSKITPDMKNPYASSGDLFKDIQQNNHMWYYPTEQGFGSGAIKDNPLLKTVDVDGEKIPANDLFRIVHDYFGHAKEGYKFGPTGEEAAWRQHLQMFTPEAQKALTTETRGQNSWVNFGPHGEANRANPAATTYAEQKTGLLPPWAMEPTGAPPKYSEPRGVLRQTSPTSHEIVVPQKYSSKNLSLSGSTPEEALTAYRSIYGEGEPLVAPNPEALSKRLVESKQAQNAVKPEEATQVLTRSDIHKLAGLGGAALGGEQQLGVEQISPLPKIEKGMDWYRENIRKPVQEASESASKYFMGKTTPLQGDAKEQFLEENAPIMGAVVNPTNFIPYGPEADLGVEAFSGLRGMLNDKPEDEDNTLP